jgi:hypothetical protein
MDETVGILAQDGAADGIREDFVEAPSQVGTGAYGEVQRPGAIHSHRIDEQRRDRGRVVRPDCSLELAEHLGLPAGERVSSAILSRGRMCSTRGERCENRGDVLEHWTIISLVQ